MQGIVVTAVNDQLGRYFEEHPSTAKKVLEKAVLAARAREAARKAREVVRKGVLDMTDRRAVTQHEVERIAIAAAERVPRHLNFVLRDRAAVCSYNDNVATPLYALLNVDPTFNGPRFESGLRSLSDWAGGYQVPYVFGNSQHREFYYFGDRHGAIAVDDIWRTPGLLEFPYAQIEFKPEWSTVRP